MGPQLVFRPGAKDFGGPDVCCIHDIICRLLDGYADDEVTPEDITPALVQEKKEEYEMNDLSYYKGDMNI